VPYFALKIHQIQFSAGAPSQIPLGAHSAPRPPSWIWEREEKGERETEGIGEGKGQKTGGGGKGRGRRGKGRGVRVRRKGNLLHEAEGIDVPA